MARGIVSKAIVSFSLGPSPLLKSFDSCLLINSLSSSKAFHIIVQTEYHIDPNSALC